MSCTIPDNITEDLTFAGVDPSLLHKIDISDPEGLERFLSNLEENFSGTISGIVPGRTDSSSNIKTKLLNWADQQSSERRKEIHHRVAEFIKRLEASQEQQNPKSKNIKRESSMHSLEECTEELEEKREETEDANETSADVSRSTEENDICILENEKMQKNEDTEPSLSQEASASENSREISVELNSEESDHPLAQNIPPIDVPQLDEDVPIPSSPPSKTETCQICYEDVAPLAMYTLSCRHRYCKECLRAHITVRINSGWLIAVPCLHPACSESIPDSDIYVLTQKEDYEKYKRFQELAELNSNPTCRWCPKPDCNTAVIADPSDDNFPCLVCTKCPTKFCYDCSAEWHPNLTCKENEKIVKTSKDRKSDKWRKNHKIRKCAQCGMDIQKDSGCNHMKCTRCGYEFCWICMTQFVPDHYINGSCAGLQFTAHPTLKRRFAILKRVLIGAVVVIVAIPIVLVVAGIGIIVIIVTVPIYAAYKLIKYLKRRWSKKSNKKRTILHSSPMYDISNIPDPDFSMV